MENTTTVYIVHRHSIGWTQLEGVYAVEAEAYESRNRVTDSGDLASVTTHIVQGA